VDRQVKIRGQRVDLDEIVRVVLEGAGIADAHAVALEPGDGVGLAVSPEDADLDEILRLCRAELPAAAVPTAAVAVPALRRGPSGKIDSHWVQQVARPRRTVVTLRTPAEVALAPLWEEALGLSRASRHDDFFDMGGNSISAMRLVSAIRTRLRRDIAVEDVFGQRTLADLAASLSHRGEPEEWEDVPAGSPAVCSAAQQRLWFLDQVSSRPSAYNITMAERLDGDLDPAAFRRALVRVQEQHEVLRWFFPADHGAPEVRVGPAGVLDLTEADLRGQEQASADSVVTSFLLAAIDLQRGPLWRILLARVGERRWVLAMSIHHAVFDGWSQDVLYDDLSRHYNAEASPPSERLGGNQPDPAGRDGRRTFADYVAWRAARDRRRGESDLAWWYDRLNGAPSVLDLPRDYPRPRIQTWRGARRTRLLPPETGSAVARASARLGVTHSTVLLAGFAELAFRLSGRTDVIIGTPAADRRHPAFEPMVGFFVEILPLRLGRRPETTADELIRLCRDCLIDSVAHPSVSLDQLVAHFRPARDPDTSPLIQVLFNVFNFRRPRLSLEGVTGAPAPAPVTGSLFDLTLYVVDEDDGVGLEVVYNRDLFAESRIDALLAGFCHLLDGLLAGPRRPAADVDFPEITQLAAGQRASDVAMLRAGRRPSVRSAASPRTPMEVLLADAWQVSLGQAGLGLDDSFFDIGGTSLQVLSLRAVLEDRLARRIPVVDFFLHPTIRTMAAHLDGQRRQGRVSAAERAQLRLASARQRTPRPFYPHRDQYRGDAS
jgi:acyl carrier protein